MRSEHDGYGWIVVTILLIGFAFFAAGWQADSDKAAINKWAVKNNYRVISCKSSWTSGPFWFNDDDDRFYYAVLADKLEVERACYFRFRASLFGDGLEQAWEK